MDRMIEKREAERKREREVWLEDAIAKKNYSMISVLLNRGVDPNAMGKDPNTGMSLLHIAAENGDAGVALMLLEKGASLDPQSYMGYTPLMLAAKHENPLAAKLLIERGADVLATDNKKCTAMHVAAKHGRAEVCEALIAAGANVNAMQDEWYARPLHLAAREGHVDACRVLLEAGAWIDAITLHHDPALTLAAKKGHLDVCRLLVEHGADPDRIFHKRWGQYSYRTPCQEAVASGRADVATFFLVNCNSNPALKSRGGETMNELAKKHPEILRVLRALEVQANVESSVSETAQEEGAPVQKRSAGMSPL